LEKASRLITRTRTTAVHDPLRLHDRQFYASGPCCTSTARICSGALSGTATVLLRRPLDEAACERIVFVAGDAADRMARTAGRR
jgi:hypothetical protein